MGNSESKPTATSTSTTAGRHSMPARSATANSRRASSAPALRDDPNAAAATTRASVGITPIERGGIERGQQATEEATTQLGYWYLIKNGYTELVHLIIRPPRAEYDQEDLGPELFTFCDRAYQRKDFVVVNDRNQNLQCSHWLPVEDNINGLMELPCVIYLHGNSSCRLEALGVIRTCLSSGMTVVAFDCAGCGKSDGEYISLGYYEREDLKAVIEYLRTTAKVSTIGLWGRSMGAATALLHADRDPSIAGIVVDSAFTNLEQLVQEIVERGRREGYTIPGFLVKIAMKFIRSSVQRRAQFDIKQLSPIDHAAVSFVPALFVAATGDDFIGPHHSDQLFAQYAGDKNIVKVTGDHNTSRPQFLLDSVGIFLQTALQVDPRLLPERSLAGGSNGNTGNSRAPWSNASWSSRTLRMMDLDAAFSGKNGMHVAKEAWACPSCTYVNRPLRLQCELCRTLYFPPDAEDGVSSTASSEDTRRARKLSRAVSVSAASSASSSSSSASSSSASANASRPSSSSIVTNESLASTHLSTTAQRDSMHSQRTL